MAGDYRFSFGPWNIHEGADPFGPPVRPSIAFAKKLKMYKKLGFDAVQFHDDDAVPDLEDLTPAEIRKEAAADEEDARRTRAWWPSSSPRGCGSIPTASTAATRPTTPRAASGPSSAPSGRSTSPTPWAPS